LQCGGSDAFSGISANPLVGLLSRDLVAHGGSANLAETDELIGAESYILQNVRELETAKAFLATIDRFQQWAARHGHSAEGNPSGGNMYRGLYNITIKSIGAARKKDPATRLDYVIDFGEPMPKPGFYFMNSPGNDLESIAGQVASGCNLILFATGNGSITNFPFVPTIKFMTTTPRFELVRNEMDFNAGRHLDGEPLEALGQEAFTLMLQVASGESSAGERAGHSQVQLWREWRGDSEKTNRERENQPLGHDNSSVSLPSNLSIPDELLAHAKPERVALVLPTSLCSGQVAAMIAEKLNAASTGNARPFSHAIALPHTEGCGNCAGESEQLFLRTMAGYLAHPFVAKAVLLEHGCEKTHNDAFTHVLRSLRIDPSHYGFASIQLDGGIERVTRKVLNLFSELPPAAETPIPFSIGFASEQPTALERETVRLLAAALADRGIASVTTESFQVDGTPLEYGERFTESGGYTMRTPTPDLLEMNTGLAATGVQMIVVFSSNGPVPGNPLVPSCQAGQKASDLDLVYSPKMSPPDLARRILTFAADLRLGRVRSRSAQVGNVAFQITRGYTGISL
jgi:altronate dehydratase